MLNTEVKKNTVEFNYTLQVWIKFGVIQDCGHNYLLSDCCNARKFRGRILERVLTGKEN